MSGRILRSGVSTGLLLCGLVALPACAQRDVHTMRSTAHSAVASGDYDQAVGLLRQLVRSDSATAADRRGYVRLLLEMGQISDAVDEGRRLSAADPEVWTALGEALLASGARGPAESTFTRAINQRASDQDVARVGLGVLRVDQGNHDAAHDLFVDAADRINRAGANATAQELTALGIAYRYLGSEDPALFKDALAALDRAIAADPDDHSARVRLGELFLEKYNGPDAIATFREVLAVNPRHARALLGMARHAYFDGADSTFEFTRLAIEANPSLPEAHTFLAKLHLDTERVAEAMAAAEKALAINPTDLPALAMLAAARFVASDSVGFAEARGRALALNPRNADFYADLADAAGRVRLYRDGERFAAQAVRLDPRSWRALALLGTNELRLGAIDKGRRDLESAFAGDPYNVWTKNTLDLLDHLVTWQVHIAPDGRFAFVIDSSRSALLLPYVMPLAVEAFDSLAARYQYVPPTPIRLEIYESHADFSVRTVGLAGLGALGVSFGSVLAMDSPFARQPGDFNWGSTLWHELGHAFTLGMTDHRVPRWLSEGLSVLEERRARPAWGQRASPGFLSILKADRLLPVSQMNNGFIRPAYPGQIGHAYYEASLVCEFIEERWGMPAMLDILRGYRDRQTTDAIISRVLDLSADALDQAFDTWIRTRFATELTAVSAAPRPNPGDRPRVGLPVPTTEVNPGDYTALLAAGRELYQRNDLDGAETTFRLAIPLFPSYAGPGNPYTGLALIHRDRGEKAQAVAMLAEVTQRNETAIEENTLEAGFRAELGDTVGATEALDRTLYMGPGDLATHTRLAELYTRMGQFDLAVRERKAVLVLGPVDRAEAEYRLALAYQGAGDLTTARRAVLRALEIAPNFVDAQTLLLALRRAAAGGTR